MNSFSLVYPKREPEFIFRLSFCYNRYSFLSPNCSTVTISSSCFQANQWVKDFVSVEAEGYQLARVTPYMHSMVYHVPGMMKTLGHVKPFSGQGMMLHL